MKHEGREGKEGGRLGNNAFCRGQRLKPEKTLLTFMIRSLLFFEKNSIEGIKGTVHKI